jgi:hypothetical protein
MNDAHTAPTPSQPWWRFGHVWLVLSGPAVVVLASFFTLYLAITRGDPVVDQKYLQASEEVDLDHRAAAGAMTPSLQGRNHAATGGLAAKPH